METTSPDDAKIDGSARTHNLVNLRNDDRRTIIALHRFSWILMDFEGNVPYTLLDVAGVSCFSWFLMNFMVLKAF